MTPRLRLAFLLAAALPLAACATQTDSEPWSTKGESAGAGRAAAVSDQPTVASEPRRDASAAQRPRAAAPPPAATGPVDPRELRVRALGELERASRDDWALVRANAIEALTSDRDAVEPAAARGLVDENRGVRFVAVGALARAQRCDLAHLVEPLRNDPSLSVQAGAIGMLVGCGRQIDQSPLAAMVMSDDPEVRANAYVALGHIGNRSAIPMVRASLGRGFALADPMRVRIVELQAAEAMVRMGELQEIEPVRAALFAPGEQGELTVLACQIIGRLRDERSRPMLFRLVEATGEAARPPEIRVAALDALGRLGGGPSLAVPLRGFLFDASPVVRAQAASAAGSVGGGELLGDLSRLLDDPEPIVRVSAAGSILRLTAGAQASARANTLGMTADD